MWRRIGVRTDPRSDGIGLIKMVLYNGFGTKQGAGSWITTHSSVPGLSQTRTPGSVAARNFHSSRQLRRAAAISYPRTVVTGVVRQSFSSRVASREANPAESPATK